MVEKKSFHRDRVQTVHGEVDEKILVFEPAIDEFRESVFVVDVFTPDDRVADEYRRIGFSRRAGDETVTVVVVAQLLRQPEFLREFHAA